MRALKPFVDLKLVVGFLLHRELLSDKERLTFSPLAHPVVPTVKVFYLNNKKIGT
jgi:hypothetical protein